MLCAQTTTTATTHEDSKPKWKWVYEMKWNVGDKSDKDNGNDNHETTRSSKAINVYTANKYRYISSSARTTTKTTNTVPRAYLIFYGYVQVSMFVLWFQTENINLCKQATKFHMAVWWLHQTGRNKRERCQDKSAIKKCERHVILLMS